jgi:hypothetical protein
VTDRSDPNGPSHQWSPTRHPESAEGRRDRRGRVVMVIAKHPRNAVMVTRSWRPTAAPVTSGSAPLRARASAFAPVPCARAPLAAVVAPAARQPAAPVTTRRGTAHRARRKDAPDVSPFTRGLDHLVRACHRLAYPSRAFWLFGLVSVLLDLDHLPRFMSVAFLGASAQIPPMGKGTSLRWQTPPSRFCHWPMVVLLWAVCLCLGTLSLGLLAYKLGEAIVNKW